MLGEIFEKCESLSCEHAFSTRLGGVSPQPFESLNLGLKNDNDSSNAIKNWNIFSKATKISFKYLAIASQVHKADVKIVGKDECMAPQMKNYIGQYDGLVTNDENVCLAIFTADCTPVLLHDPKNKIIAALHCGWRPLCADIILEGIKKMKNLGAQEKYIEAGIGPCINKCCFETGAEVADAVNNLLNQKENKCLEKSNDDNNKYFIDLRKTVQTRLQQLGVLEKNISHVTECTSCDNKKYFSYRKENGITGRMASVIKLNS